MASLSKSITIQVGPWHTSCTPAYLCRRGWSREGGSHLQLLPFANAQIHPLSIKGLHCTILFNKLQSEFLINTAAL